MEKKPRGQPDRDEPLHSHLYISQSAQGAIQLRRFRGPVWVSDVTVQIVGMNDKQLYATLLGFGRRGKFNWSTWPRERTVEVVVELNADSKPVCPECGNPAPRYDKRMRSWRHLDTMQFRTILTCEVPRVNCAKHGIHQVAVPWAEPGGRFTAMFECLVIDLLMMASFKAVAEHTGLSCDEVDGIRGRAVRRGVARKKPVMPTRIGVDETSFQKRHEYVTVVTDLDRGTVEDVGDGRSGDARSDDLQMIDTSRLEVVSMDMWAPYIKATMEHVPDAVSKIAFDKFHVARHLGDAVDKVRKLEHREMLAAGDRRLTSTKYLWLTSPENMTNAQREQFFALKRMSLKVGRAWALKEAARRLWDYRTAGWARKAWTSWMGWAQRCRLEPVNRVARWQRGTCPESSTP